MKIIGLKFVNKKIFKNKKGDVLKYITKKDFFFKGFGEIYFSEILKNKTKGWNFHKRNTCLIMVPTGKVKFCFVDGRKKSKSYNIKVIKRLSKKNLQVVVIPPGVWFSFTSITNKSLVVNMLDKPHKNTETIKSKKIKNIFISD
tara:strand:- start:110 stop:541 length:432 start_codon:yes stop_codon:yes gene_type:complete